MVYRDEGQLETANPSNECLVDQYRYCGAPYHFNIDSNSFLSKPIAGDNRLQPLSSDSACALMDSSTLVLRWRTTFSPWRARRGIRDK